MLLLLLQHESTRFGKKVTFIVCSNPFPANSVAHDLHLLPPHEHADAVQGTSERLLPKEDLRTKAKHNMSSTV